MYSLGVNLNEYYLKNFLFTQCFEMKEIDLINILKKFKHLKKKKLV